MTLNYPSEEWLKSEPVNVTVGEVYMGSASVSVGPGSAWIGLISTASIQGKTELVASVAKVGFATVNLGLGGIVDTYDQNYAWSFQNSAVTTSIINAGPCVLNKIVVGAVSQPTVTFWNDDAMTAGSQFFGFSAGVPVGSYECNISLSSGLTADVTLGVTPQMLVVYK